jgi:hypothetical protein
MKPMYTAPRIAPESTLGPTAVVARALFVGAACGLASGALAGIPYWLAYADRYTAPWTMLAVAFALFSLGTGACVGVGTATGMLMVDRLAARFRGAASAFGGATIGGALVGIVPGAFGTAYFGQQPAPFMGTTAIAILPFAGVLALSALVADIDRRAAGSNPKLVWLVAYAITTIVPFLAAGVLFVLSVGEDGLARIGREMLPGPSTASLAMLGSSYGMVLGGALGAHVGLTTAVARLRTA